MTRDDEVFGAALKAAGPERQALLDGACGGDLARRARVEALLRGHERAADFLKTPLSARCTVVPEEGPGDAIDRYKLVERIGEGGCGVVWSADQTEPVRRRVALKLIKLGMDTREVVARFAAERQAVALMDHPNIAKVFDGGATVAGRPYFVMELVRGTPITMYCDAHQLTPRRRIELFIQVCHAVQHAHQKGIIHRDLKPSNILVTDEIGSCSSADLLRPDRMEKNIGQSPRPVPKVIDFGIAKATQGRLTDQTLFTALDQFIGTPVYMSPEQAERSSTDIDSRSDIYSLGVLLYELLAGEPPFNLKDSPGVDQIRQRIRTEDPPKPSTRYRMLGPDGRETIARTRGTLPPQLATLLQGDLDWIVMRCLEKERARRYETTDALAMDLQRYLQHEPIVARPPSNLYVLQKLVRRHRWGFAAALSIFVVLALGVIASTWQAIRATRAEREQSRLRATAEAQELAARRRAYAADMNLLQRALTIEDPGRARELLDLQRPLPGQIDLRGWEWRYLWQWCRSDDDGLLCQKAEAIRSLGLSPDGTWLTIVEDTESLSLWNLRTREELNLGGNVVRTAFAPSGPLLAIAEISAAATPPNLRRSASSALRAAIADTASADPGAHRIRIWNLETRQTVREWTLPSRCVSLGFSADGQTLVTSSGGPRNRIQLWRVADGSPRASHAAPTNTEMMWNILAVDGELSAVAHAAPDHHVRVIDPATGVQRWAARAGDREVTAIAFSPDGRILATNASPLVGRGESPIRLWDAQTGRELGQLDGHREYVRQILFWPDGSRLASAGRDRTVRVWDVASRKLLHTFRGHDRPISSLVLLPDNATLLSGCADGTVRFWNAAAPPSPVMPLTVPARLAAWRFAPDSRSILSVDAAGHFVRWTGREFQQRETGPKVAPTGAARIDVQIASTAPLVASREKDGVIRVWNWAERTMLREIDTGGRSAVPAAFLANGRKLLTTPSGAESAVGALQEWDLSTGTLLRAWPAAGATDFAVSDDGKQCLIRNPGGTTSRIDLVSGREDVLSVTIQQGYPPAFSADGTLIAAPNIRNAEPPWIWDAATLQLKARLSGFIFGGQSAAFSPDGRRLATGSGSNLEAVVLREVGTYYPVLGLEASGMLFQSTAFSPDGNVIGSMTFSGTLYLWRAPTWSEVLAAEAAATPHPPRPKP